MAKSLKVLAAFAILMCSDLALSQGTFMYDQQSSTDESTPAFGSGVTIQTASPYGESFTPSLATIDFVRLKLNDSDPASGSGATLLIQLHSSSISGAIVASTTPVSLANGFAGTANFFFSAPVSVPGTTYVFEPIVQSGEPWNVDAHELNYPGGTAIFQGSMLPGSDLWFREGIIIPEPTSASLILLGVGAGIFAWRQRKCPKY